MPQAHQADVARGAEAVWAFLQQSDVDMHDQPQARTPWTLAAAGTPCAWKSLEKRALGRS